MASEGLCAHKNFGISTRVDYIEDKDDFTLDIAVECTDCGMPFQFKGVPGGMSFQHPTTDITQMEMCCPIVPVEATLPIPARLRKCFEGIKRRMRGEEE